LAAQLLAGRETRIPRLRNQAARAAPDGRACRIQSQDLVTDQRREVDDIVRERRGASVHELGEVTNVRDVRDAEAPPLTPLTKRVEQPQQRVASILPDELHEVRGA